MPTKAKTTVRKSAPRERWRLFRTLTASTAYTIPYTPGGTTTPYADVYRQLYTQLTDELLCMSSYTAKSIKIRTQEKTIEAGRQNGATRYSVTAKLFIYTVNK